MDLQEQLNVLLQQNTQDAAKLGLLEYNYQSQKRVLIDGMAKRQSAIVNLKLALAEQETEAPQGEEPTE